MIKKMLKKIDRLVFADFYDKSKDQYLNLLHKSILKDCKTVLDVGCGAAGSPVSLIKDRLNYSIGVDAYLPSIESSERSKAHTEHKHMDVTKIAEVFKPKSFDCVVALDLIEHLTKEEGKMLLKNMESIAIKKVIVFTPNGYINQDIYDNNEYQIHKSGWSAKEMKKLGYKVVGINGLKILRGEYAKPKFKPTILWERILYITQYFTKANPRFAFQIFCIKELPTK